MLDPAKPEPIDIKDFTSYITNCVSLAGERLAGYGSVEEVAADEDKLNIYPRLGHLEKPHDIIVLEDLVDDGDIERAREALLDGGVLLEHTCAGEATRLGLGTKYLINPRLDLSPQVLGELLGEGYELDVNPGEMASISLGRRHMLQLAWDIENLAKEHGRDPDRVMGRQRLLVIVNQSSWQTILHDFQEAGFYGFDRNNVLFMVQQSFHGINLGPQGWFYDNSSLRRLHNHGQMLLQTTMDNQIFRLDTSGRPRSLSWPEYRQILGEFDDKISFNIEDLDYLSYSLDLEGLAGALKLAEGGARMIMEVVGNDPDNPIKGGMCAWDPKLGRDVVIESFQLAGVPYSEITHLNRNINHYPYPAVALTQARERGLAMPLAVKDGHVYFQPVQGDLNFLVQTAFVRRRQVRSINSWKSAANTAPALQAMAAQEARKGFMPWARKLTGLDL